MVFKRRYKHKYLVKNNVNIWNEWEDVADLDLGADAYLLHQDDLQRRRASTH